MKKDCRSEKIIKFTAINLRLDDDSINNTLFACNVVMS